MKKNFNQTTRKILSFVLKVPFLPKKYVDFILWPLANKVLPSDYSENIKTKSGIFIGVYQDIYDYTNKKILFFGESMMHPYEPETSKLLRRLIKEKKTAFIAGAHLGFHVLLTAKENPNATIFTFEPVKKMFNRLLINIDLNGFSNIIAENIAAAEQEGISEMVDDSGQSTLVIHAGNNLKAKELIKTISLDTYFSKLKVIPELMLLDLEGYEVAALKGAKNILQEHKPDLIIEINNKMLKRAGTSSDELFSLLEKFGYETERINDDPTDDWYNIFATQKK